jgi:hypothetical protein|uniref:Uncharacterized protein n=1 Tax=Siphoviridae sp. ctsf32 TaxID=2827594 RepID=A0A8S5LNB7_9CAUD|nr:MAG TPA: hypothetical protein [Siphoviridae sp. ctsf32]
MKQIQVPEDLRNKIQSIDFELTATKDLISFLWGQDPVNMEAINYYTKQQRELFIEFETAKSALEEIYHIKKDTPWNLDYNTCILSINED